MNREENASREVMDKKEVTDDKEVTVSRKIIGKESKKINKEAITIRKMLVKDLPQVCEIERQSFSIPWSKKSFEDSLKLSHAIFLVAYLRRQMSHLEEQTIYWRERTMYLEEQILGYCGVYQVFNEGDITNIAVAPEYRGMGIAGKLLEAVFANAAERGIEALTLEVRESNAPAIHLYRKYSFEQVGIRKNFYEKPREHAVIMWKRGLE